MLTLDGIIDSKENLEMKRALAVKRVLIGFKTKDICRILGVSDAFVSKWKIIYENEGPEALRLQYKGGKGFLTEGRWCINKMRVIFPPLSVFSRQNNPAGDGNGHTEVGHDIQRGDAYLDLGDLGFEQSGGQTLTEQLFEPIHGIFSETAAMIADHLFPGGQPVRRDGGQRWGAGMIGRPRHRVRPWRDGDCGAPFPGHRVDFLRVIRPVPPDMADGVIDLLEQSGQYLTIRPWFSRDLNRQDLLDVGIHRQMHLTPSAPFPGAMPADFPFALALHFHAGGIDHHVDGSTPRPAWNRPCQGFRPTRQQGRVRNRQRQAHQLDDRARQPFDHPIGQVEYRLERQQRLNGRVRVLEQCPPLAGRSRPPAVLQKRFIEPDRQTAPAHQGAIILGPVRDPILDFLRGSFRRRGGMRSHNGFSVFGDP